MVRTINVFQPLLPRAKNDPGRGQGLAQSFALEILKLAKPSPTCFPFLLIKTNLRVLFIPEKANQPTI